MAKMKSNSKAARIPIRIRVGNRIYPTSYDKRDGLKHAIDIMKNVAHAFNVNVQIEERMSTGNWVATHMASPSKRR
jgi:hypothetical protein